MNRSCRTCHGIGKKAPPLPLPPVPDQKRAELFKTTKFGRHERIIQDDDYRFSRHVLLNMTNPEHSRLLLAPLPEDKGGWGTCEHKFSGPTDRDYTELLHWLNLPKKQLKQKPLYGMPTFRPNKQFIREMKRFGVLAADFNPGRGPIDFFEIEQKYWELFWYQADAREKWPFMR